MIGRSLELTLLDDSLNIQIEHHVPVTMRDGTILYANVFRPISSQPTPALLLRTPYGKPSGGLQAFVRAGYAVVTQDTRGRYESGGDWIPFFTQATGDAEDGYDSVEWLAAQPWCNGAVGTFGRSYEAWMQWMLAKLRPPHLRAMAAFTIPTELTEVDWPGAFRPARRLHWWFTAMAPDLRRRFGLPGHTDTAQARSYWEQVERGLKLGLLPWMKLPRHLPEPVAANVEAWLKNPNARPWRFREAHQQIEVPNLDVSGWFDHCNGSIGHLSSMQRQARTELARQQTKLVIGPWNHTGLGRRKLNEFDFGVQAEVDLNALLIRWFDYHLKGLSNGVCNEAAVRYFVMGSNQWRAGTTWPPPVSRQQTLFLRHDSSSGLQLLPSAPTTAEPAAHYDYDPDDPVPTLWNDDMVTVPADRAPLDHREDVLHYRTPPLERDLEVVGEPEMILHASSSAVDTDFIVHLIDEAPDGRALGVSQGFVRARHRHSLDHTDLLTPGQVVELRIRLGPTACCFRAGHRLRLDVTSSDFPNYDRNHNTGGNDLVEATFVVAHQQIVHAPTQASRLVLPQVTDVDNSISREAIEEQNEVTPLAAP